MTVYLYLQGNEELKQHKEETTQEELSELFKKSTLSEPIQDNKTSYVTESWWKSKTVNIYCQDISSWKLNVFIVIAHESDTNNRYFKAVARPMSWRISLTSLLDKCCL